MRKPAFLLVAAFASVVSFAEIQVIDGVKYECTDGLCRIVDDDPVPATTNAVPSPLASHLSPPGHRLAQGYMPAPEFIAFLENKPVEPLGRSGLWLTLLLILLGGLAMNLTPCVLPMIPINLIVIGRSAKRGAVYGLGMATAYGLLGVASAVGGLAFGSIQSNPWFNAAVALVFIALALSLFGVFFIDLSRFRPTFQSNNSNNSNTQTTQTLTPFLLGSLSAVLAGACVAPILISVLLLTADLYAKGNAFALALPFVLGLGMALPWPFLGAGLKVLPKPGRWMPYVNRLFGVLVLGFAAYYGRLAIRGWTGADTVYGKVRDEVRVRDLEKFVAGSKRPVLVDCWASWCKNCAAMERVMSEESVKRALVPFRVVHVQAEDLGELRKVKGFEGVRGLPAFVIFE